MGPHQARGLDQMALLSPLPYGTGSSYTSTSLYVSMAWCLMKKRNNFTFHQYRVVQCVTYRMLDQPIRLL